MCVINKIEKHRFVLLSHAVDLTGLVSVLVSFSQQIFGLSLDLGLTLPGLGLGFGLTMFWSH